MKITNSTVKKLLVFSKEMSTIGKIKAVLDWDLNVNLPVKGSAERAQQSAYLTGLVTKLWHRPELVETLEKAKQLDPHTLSQEENAIVRNLDHAGKFYSKVPEALIIRKEKVTSEAFMAWKAAREKNAFKDFLPHLSEIIAIEKEIAGHLGYKENPYDALLDQFEPELTADYVQETFGRLRQELVALVQKIKKSTLYVDRSELIDGRHTYPKRDQKKLALFVMNLMGYDFQAGRLDVSPHPFTTSLGRYDIRTTTMFKKLDFRDSYTSSMHETGHALYEQGIDPLYSETPLEGGVSYGIHEALSRFWENMVGKNPNFLRFISPIFQSFYPDQLAGIFQNDIVRLFNMVKPSYIRIEADEVTYSLHIILRFEMENALMSGKIAPKDAAEVWRAKSKELFGIEPTTDAEGVLQDVHWSYGAFGYFPSYALGNLYGAQFLHTMKKDMQFDNALSQGNLLDIKTWLDEHVHKYGSLYLPKDLVKKATGEALNPQYFVDYLKKKYTEIYHL